MRKIPLTLLFTALLMGLTTSPLAVASNADTADLPFSTPREVTTIAIPDLPLQGFQVALASTPPVTQAAEFTVLDLEEVSWPLPSTVRTDGFGPRSCDGCSSMHMGVDFTPGNGAAIKSISAGIVRDAGVNGSYGYTVIVDHVFDGVPTSTLYAHMQAGSIQVEPGQKIDRGTLLGLVGSTGSSSGPHLHFEVSVDGVKVDPEAWMSAHSPTDYPAG